MDRVSSIRCFSRCALVGGLLALCAGGAVVRAQDAADPPDALALGKWILAPWFETRVEVDTNFGRLSSDLDSPLVEQTTSITAGLEASLPFKNSLLGLRYAIGDKEFEQRAANSGYLQDGGVDLALHFGTGDILSLVDDFQRGFSDVRDPNSPDEVRYQGEPYRRNRWGVQLLRQLSGRQGYRLQVQRRDFNWDGDPDPLLSFFDYRGFDSTFEFYQPLSAGRWLSVYYNTQTFNHYESNCPEVEGVPFRKEESRSLQVGANGTLGRGQPFQVRVGYGIFRYDELRQRACRPPLNSEEGNAFRGLQGEGSWRLSTGGRSGVNLSARRRPLPSGFDTFYINNEFRADFDRPWLRNSVFGFGVRTALNHYGDEVGSCEGDRRKDQLFDLTAFILLRIHRRMGLDVGAGHYRRNSNCLFSDYVATSVSVGLSFGWF